MVSYLAASGIVRRFSSTILFVIRASAENQKNLSLISPTEIASNEQEWSPMITSDFSATEEIAIFRRKMATLTGFERVCGREAV